MPQKLIKDLTKLENQINRLISIFLGKYKVTLNEIEVVETEEVLQSANPKSLTTIKLSVIIGSNNYV